MTFRIRLPLLPRQVSPPLLPTVTGAYFQHAWIPASVGCRADFNGDGVVDFFDYLDFVDAFSSGSPEANFNNDEAVDFFDYLDFVDAFSEGC